MLEKEESNKTAPDSATSPALPKFQKGQYGSSRSLIRMIATVFPIRPKYEIMIVNHSTPVRCLEQDFEDIDNEGGDGLSLAAGLRGLWEQPLNEGTEPSSAPCHTLQEHSTQEDTFNEQNARKKIASMEEELSKLRTQIANYALNHVDMDSIPSLDTRSEGEMSAPVSSMPPPPPPAPPLPATFTNQHHSMETTDSGTVTSHPFEMPKHARSLLTEISGVKLKATERSPGGTPLRTHQHDLHTPDNNDPAAIIARALQKKFSHLVFQDSPCSDVQDDEFSPVDSLSFS